MARLLSPIIVARLCAPVALGLLTVAGAPIASALAAQVTLAETGSTLIYPVFRIWAAEYPKTHPGVTVSAAATNSAAADRTAWRWPSSNCGSSGADGCAAVCASVGFMAALGRFKGTTCGSRANRAIANGCRHALKAVDTLGQVASPRKGSPGTVRRPADVKQFGQRPGQGRVEGEDAVSGQEDQSALPHEGVGLVGQQRR